MAKSDRLTGVQKAAILFITLGPEVSSHIIKKLPDNVIQKITFEIANTVKIKGSMKDSVLEEFVNLNKAKDYMLEGGMDYAKNLLSKALGVNKAMEIIEQVSEITQQFRPFGIARKADPQQLLSLIMNEHPQTIALITCYLQPEKAGQILSGLPIEVQADVAKRVAAMRSTSPAVVQEVEKVLEKRLSSVIRPDLATIGGIGSLVQILNQVDRGTEKNIIEHLGKDEPELAEEIRANMFVFEDIINLDSASIQRIIREIDNKDLSLALKGSSEEVAEVVYKNMSKRAAATLREDIEYLGPVRLIDVEKAQQNIVSIIRRLDEAGEIIIGRGGEDAVII